MTTEREQLWVELEAAVPGVGHVKRRVHPESNRDIFLGVEQPAGSRMMLMPIGEDAVRGFEELPETKCLELRLERPGDDDADVNLKLVLTDSSFADVFDALVDDVSDSVAASGSEAVAATVFVERLHHWQRFLTRVGPQGLTPEQQRGLYGELTFLDKVLVPIVGGARAVDMWTGPAGTNQDFQAPKCAVEVKTSMTAQAQNLRIASERQLDGTGVAQLFLYHLSLDVRQQGQGESLGDLVDQVRTRLGSSSHALERFESLLLEAGYARHLAHLYANKYSARDSTLFAVDEGFPRLVEADLPDGVGNVRYSVAVSACAAFEVETPVLQVALVEGAHD